MASIKKAKKEIKKNGNDPEMLNNLNEIKKSFRELHWCDRELRKINKSN